MCHVVGDNVIVVDHRRHHVSADDDKRHHHHVVGYHDDESFLWDLKVDRMVLVNSYNYFRQQP